LLLLLLPLTSSFGGVPRAEDDDSDDAADDGMGGNCADDEVDSLTLVTWLRAEEEDVCSYSRDDDNPVGGDTGESDPLCCCNPLTMLLSRLRSDNRVIFGVVFASVGDKDWDWDCVRAANTLSTTLLPLPPPPRRVFTMLPAALLLEDVSNCISLLLYPAAVDADSLLLLFVPRLALRALAPLELDEACVFVCCVFGCVLVRRDCSREKVVSSSDDRLFFSLSWKLDSRRLVSKMRSSVV
jgi:hypothetical protein